MRDDHQGGTVIHALLLWVPAVVAVVSPAPYVGGQPGLGGPWRGGVPVFHICWSVTHLIRPPYTLRPPGTRADPPDKDTAPPSWLAVPVGGGLAHRWAKREAGMAPRGAGNQWSVLARGVGEEPVAAVAE